jgi:hypothetical protein
MAKKVLRLTESQLTNVIKKIVNEHNLMLESTEMAQEALSSWNSEDDGYKMGFLKALIKCLGERGKTIDRHGNLVDSKRKMHLGWRVLTDIVLMLGSFATAIYLGIKHGESATPSGNGNPAAGVGVMIAGFGFAKEAHNIMKDVDEIVRCVKQKMRGGIIDNDPPTPPSVSDYEEINESLTDGHITPEMKQEAMKGNCLTPSLAKQESMLPSKHKGVFAKIKEAIYKLKTEEEVRSAISEFNLLKDKYSSSLDERDPDFVEPMGDEPYDMDNNDDMRDDMMNEQILAAGATATQITFLGVSMSPIIFMVLAAGIFILLMLLLLRIIYGGGDGGRGVGCPASRRYSGYGH